MRVAIITENFLPKLDGVTRTLARLLEHLHMSGHQALLLGPESGMEQYAGAEVVGTAGLPFPFYPELKWNFFRPLFVRRLKEFCPDIIHLVDPVILGAPGLATARLLKKPVVSSYHTNLAAYCGHFGFAPLTKPMWSYNRFMHNQCALTFCPSPSTAAMLQEQGFHHGPKRWSVSCKGIKKLLRAWRRLWQHKSCRIVNQTLSMCTPSGALNCKWYPWHARLDSLAAIIRYLR
jgi:glycosyltransferase involved in cell wall biosynthesis